MSKKPTDPAKRRVRITAENFPVRLVMGTNPMAPDEKSQRADRFHKAMVTLIRLGGGSEALTQMGIK